MKSELDIEILMNRIEAFVDEKPSNPTCAANFKVALHILDWVLEREDAGDFSSIANEIVALAKGSVRKRISKRIVTGDHFAI